MHKKEKVKLKWNGDEEGYFCHNGIQYTTKNKVIEVDDETATHILTNNRWSKTVS